MIVPSTMVCGTSGCMPKACSATPVRDFLIWTALMLLEPMSSPMHVLAIVPVVGESPLLHATLSYSVGCPSSRGQLNCQQTMIAVYRARESSPYSLIL